MRRSTKAQRKWNDRIEAWLKGEPFKENARAKPEVPTLGVREILDNFYPPDPTGSAQFFTPPEMAQAAFDYGATFIGRGHRVLDPCAGIGHLFYPWTWQCEADDITFDAYEVDKGCVELGQVLFPGVNWQWAIPFDHLAEIEGQYDFVFCNPPFNIRRGMMLGEEMSQGRARKSEHIFLELCVRALKPEGQAVMFGPYNYMDKLPKKMRAWFDERAVVDYTWGPLPGEFALTKIQLHAYYITRRWYEQEEIVATVAEAAPRVERLPPRAMAPASFACPQQLDLFESMGGG